MPTRTRDVQNSGEYAATQPPPPRDRSARSHAHSPLTRHRVQVQRGIAAEQKNARVYLRVARIIGGLWRSGSPSAALDVCAGRAGATGGSIGATLAHSTAALLPPCFLRASTPRDAAVTPGIQLQPGDLPRRISFPLVEEQRPRRFGFSGHGKCNRLTRPLPRREGECSGTGTIAKRTSHLPSLRRQANIINRAIRPEFRSPYYAAR